MILTHNKMYNFEPYNVLLAIAVLLMTALVLQGHVYDNVKYLNLFSICLGLFSYHCCEE